MYIPVLLPVLEYWAAGLAVASTAKTVVVDWMSDANERHRAEVYR